MCEGSHPYPRQHSVWPVFFYCSVLLGMQWCDIVVFLCVSLMAAGVENIFTDFLAIFISSLEKWLFRSCDHLNWFFFKSLVARDFIQVVIRYIICTFFSQYVGCLSLFSVISLAVQFFRFLFSPVCFFSFAACTFSFIS